jgi:hypothetical protein
MDNLELMGLVDLVAASDNRNVTEQTYGAWKLVIGHLDFGLARQATLDALADETIRFIEPKHILGKVSAIREKNKTDERREKALNYTPMTELKGAPICRDHDLSIMKCRECGIKALELSKSLDGIHGHYYQQTFWVEICYPLG